MRVWPRRHPNTASAVCSGLSSAAHLHALGPYDRLPGRERYAGRAGERPPPVREPVLDDQILRRLGVDKRRGDSALRRPDRSDALEAVRLQHRGDGSVRPGRNLVDHRHRKSDPFTVREVCRKPGAARPRSVPRPGVA